MDGFSKTAERIATKFYMVRHIDNTHVWKKYFDGTAIGLAAVVLGYFDSKRSLGNATGRWKKLQKFGTISKYQCLWMKWMKWKSSVEDGPQKF